MSTEGIEEFDETPTGWTITPEELEATRAKIDKINQRAAKKGFTGHVDLDTERVENTRIDENTGLKVTEITYRVRITGDAPSYNGWALMATLDWDQEAGLITRTVPGIDTLDRSTLREGWCDHCQSKRHRKNTYLVGNADTGEQRQVGSTCIKDFLGWKANPVFLATEDLEEELGLGSLGGGPRSYDTLTVLAAAWAVIKRNGYVRANDYNDKPTRDAVTDLIDPPNNWHAREEARAYRPYIEDATEQAVKIRDWVLSDEFTGTGEYVQNLKAVAGAEYVTARNFGLLVSAPQAWAKAQERSLIRQRERAEIRNEYYGEIGQKIEIKVRVKAVAAGRFNGWGTPAIYTLIDADGYLFKWFSSGWDLGEEPSDEVITLRGTIKDHNEWRDRKETVLTRCKEVVPPAVNAAVTVTGDNATVQLSGVHQGRYRDETGTITRNGKDHTAYTNGDETGTFKSWKAAAASIAGWYGIRRSDLDITITE